MAAGARNASQPSGARPTPHNLGCPAWGSPSGSRGRAPDATMGKGEGAVDKNMRKELSLEIDGHACPDQYVNVGIGAELKCRAPHAVDATLIPWPSTQLTG